MMHVVIPSQAQDPELALVEPYQVPLHPTLYSIQVLLNGNTAFWCLNHSFQLCIVSKLAEGGHSDSVGFICQQLDFT